MRLKNRSFASSSTGLLLSLGFLASGCASVAPDIRVCAVAGVQEAGMDCAHTGSDQMDHIAPGDIRDFLEAGHGHGAALCSSSEDWGKEHAFAEEVCQRLGPGCTYEVKKSISDTSGRIDKVGK